jgi:uncharacterized membrane protein YphA (DoxX/SURF4 family)
VRVVILFGRILFGLIFVGAGVAGHLRAPDETAGYAEMRGLSNAKLLTQVSGVLIIAGGLGVILGVWADLAALGLVVYTLIAAFMIHHFWTDEDAMTQQVEMSMFMKNLSIAGGGLILFGFLAATGGAVDFMITDPVFDFDL